MAAFSAKRVKKIGDLVFGQKLRDAGFHQGKWLTFFRARDEFADVISVWRGRGAGAFYLAYFVNLLADPSAKTLGSYNVGHRPARNPQTGFVWNLSSESELEAMFDDMFGFVECEVFSFFSGMSLDRFIEETRRRGNMFNIAEAIALGISGRLAEVNALCEKDLVFLEQHHERFDDADGQAIRDVVIALKEASGDDGKFNALTNSWRESKLSELGLRD